MSKKTEDQFGKKEADERLAAALRGARIAQPKPLKDKPKKRAAAKTKLGKKPGS